MSIGIQIAIIALIVAVIGVLVTVIIPWVIGRRKKKRHLETYFKVIWQKSSKLKPRHIMGIRAGADYGFKEYYKQRDIDERISEKIKKLEHVLVTGHPLAGKTRAVYEALANLNPPATVLIPNLVDIKPEEFSIPGRVELLSNPVVVLDDIDKFAARQHFQYFLDEFLKRGILIIATCRSGKEFDRSCDADERLVTTFKNPIEIEKIEKEEAETVAQEASMEFSEEFDGNIGSLFVPIDTMRERYRTIGDDERAVLMAVKRLYEAGIYEEHEAFQADRIKLVSDKCEDIHRDRSQWRAIFQRLQASGFLAKSDGSYKVEETYLQKVIESDFERLENLRDLLPIFTDDPDASFKVGIKARPAADYLDISSYRDKVNYLNVAITAYKSALKIWTVKKHREEYAMIQNNLGIAYGTLGEVEEKSANCKKAIESYEKALKVYTFESFPIQYATTQNNLGAAYQTLSEVEEKSANCKKAIQSYKEALKVRTLDSFPIQYAGTQNNLGTAFRALGEVEEKSANCKKAIQSYKEALKLYTVESYPMDYAMTENNLGAAYQALGEVEEKSANCKKAIESFDEALKVYTLESFPMDYAMTQNNLGIAYSTLGAVEEKSAYCKKAIESCKEALKVRTLDSFPMDYAMTQNNLGIAYSILAEVEDKSANCKKAIASYNEALKVHTLESFPMDYALTSENLGIAYATLSQAENKSENCRNGRAALVAAICVFKEQHMQYNQTKAEGNLARLEGFCGDASE